MNSKFNTTNVKPDNPFTWMDDDEYINRTFLRFRHLFGSDAHYVDDTFREVAWRFYNE